MEPKVDEPAFQFFSGPVTVPPSSYPTIPDGFGVLASLTSRTPNT